MPWADSTPCLSLLSFGRDQSTCPWSWCLSQYCKLGFRQMQLWIELLIREHQCFSGGVSCFSKSFSGDIVSSMYRSMNWYIIVIWSCRNNWGDTVKASFHHLLSPATRTAVSVEIAHTVSSNERKVAIGAQHALNYRCSVKARLSSGRVGIVTKHPLGPHIVTFFGEVDLKDIKASAMGLGLALRLWRYIIITIQTLFS